MCSVLLSVFSATANAEELTKFKIRQDVYLYYPNNGTIYDENFFSFTPNNGGEEVMSHEFYYNKTDNSPRLKMKTVWNIFMPDGYTFELNKLNRVSLDNFYYRTLTQAQSIIYYNYYDELYLVIEYVDGTQERATLTASPDNSNSLDMSFSFTPTKNVKRFDVYLEVWADHICIPHSNTADSVLTIYMGEYNGDSSVDFSIEIQSEEAGLLSGLLGWVQNIFGKIGETFDKIVEIFAEIKELPSKIWGYIENGLQKLFIPSDDQLLYFSSRMDQLLEDKLGAVYQVSNTVIESWERIKESDDTDTINFPEVTINLPENNTFTFGGYNVKIVPDGFSFIVTSVKMVVGIVCTIAFINGLRKNMMM